MNQTSDANDADCSLQVQNSVTLSSMRYISIIKSIQDGDTNQAVEDMDWWVDMAIIELNYLEEKHPNIHFSEVNVPNTDGVLQMKTLYKKIAKYRNEHPRLHKIPLNSHESKAIESFVEKYK
jgi:hypothetical protein